MNKICTSIEQSKKLIELGIDIKTADMFWDTLFAKKPEAQVNNHHFIDEYDDEHRVPAWSLSALLDILPFPTLEETPITTTETKWICTIYCDAKYRSELHDDALDATFEMVCWLKENKKL